MNKLESKLSLIYKKFFEQLNVKESGELENKQFKNWKFAAYPFIGSNFFINNIPRIIFIALDIGSDELPGKIIDYDFRRKCVENNKKYNPHIAGTFITAVYFLINRLIKESVWKKIKNERSCNAAINKLRAILGADFDAMSYVAFTNYYKFVTKNRKRRIGGENRKNINKELEDKLLLAELKVFNPDIIIFQGFEFKKKKYSDLLQKIVKQNNKANVWISPHPSWHGTRVPGEYLRHFKAVNFQI